MNLKSNPEFLNLTNDNDIYNNNFINIFIYSIVFLVTIATRFGPNIISVTSIYKGFTGSVKLINPIIVISNQHQLIRFVR
jgi:hypothetical protein